MTYADIELSSPELTRDSLHHLTFQSPALEGRGNVLVWLPQDHGREENLPLVILLHGVLGSHWSWAYNGGAHLAAERLIAGKRIRPMALVMPSDGMVGRGSGYVNTHRAGCEDWIVQDVLGATRQVFPNMTESPAFIAGFSMGGFGALRLGAKHARKFKGISGLSSITHFDQLGMFIESDSPDFAKLTEQDKSALYWMKRNRNVLPPVRFDCGVEDKLYPHNVDLHKDLEKEGISHSFVEHPGTHSWQYWHDHIGESFEFFEEVLRS